MCNEIKDIVIIGAGDFGRETTNLIDRINSKEKKWNIIGFVDDNPDLNGKRIDGYDVLGDVKWLNAYDKELHAICALGVGKSRKKVVEKINNENIKYATLIDPDALIYRDCIVGEGSIICAYAIIAINTTIGKHVLINSFSLAGHDDIINDYAVLNPGCNISGKVKVGACTDLGTGSKVIQGITIGENTVVGAGGVVIRDLPDNCTAVGCPVKIIK